MIQEHDSASPTEKPTRLAELVDRLIMAGPKAAHVSASECHEINEEAHALLAELASLKQHHDRVVEQRNKDWDALMVLIATVVGTDDDRKAAENGETGELDPWHALRDHQAELAKLRAEVSTMRPVYVAAIAWREVVTLDEATGRLYHQRLVALASAIDALVQP